MIIKETLELKKDTKTIAQMITVSGRELYYHTWEKHGSTHYNVG